MSRRPVANDWSKFRAARKARIAIDRLGGTCSTCHQRIDAGERVVVWWEQWPSGQYERVSHEACAKAKVAS